MKQRILDDTKAAMRAKDSTRLTTLRMLSAAIKQIEIDKQTQLDEQGCLAVVQKMLAESLAWSQSITVISRHGTSIQPN